MSEGEVARVESVDALRDFRACIIKFAEAAQVALADAESEIRGTLNWLDLDRLSYWRDQFRKRERELVRAQEALRHKKLFKDPTGARQSFIDEERAVKKATARIEEADQKVKAVRKYSAKLQKELLLYKGQVQGLSTFVEHDLPVAVATLERTVIALEGYLAVAAGPAEIVGSEAESSAAMSRDVPDFLVAWRPNYAELRSRVPEGSKRAVAPTADEAIELGPVVRVDREKLMRAVESGVAPSGEELFVLTAPVTPHGQVFLYRVEPAFTGDSGWTLGPVDAESMSEMRLARLQHLIACGSGWPDLLSLPVGFLIVLRGGSIVAVFGPDGQEIKA